MEEGEQSSNSEGNACRSSGNTGLGGEGEGEVEIRRSLVSVVDTVVVEDDVVVFSQNLARLVGQAGTGGGGLAGNIGVDGGGVGEFDDGAWVGQTDGLPRTGLNSGGNFEVLVRQVGRGNLVGRFNRVAARDPSVLDITGVTIFTDGTVLDALSVVDEVGIEVAFLGGRDDFAITIQGDGVVPSNVSWGIGGGISTSSDQDGSVQLVAGITLPVDGRGVGSSSTSVDAQGGATVVELNGGLEFLVVVGTLTVEHGYTEK